ncbi:hypothetical protein [Thermaurantiacus sp.]
MTPLRPVTRFLALGLLLSVLPVLAGCAHDQDFPDLLPRPHEVPRQIDESASASAGLSDPERAALKEELARAQAALVPVRRAAAAAGQALDVALARARGAPVGSDSWADAQLLLSRLDQARAGYGAIEAQLAPLARLVDSTPPDDPDRRQLETLLSTIRAEALALAERQKRAARQLGGA